MFGALAMRTLGCLLLLAATLKLYGLAVEPIGGVGVFSEPWVQTLIVEWEIVLGIWLVSGVNRLGAWLMATITFVVFAGFSAWQGSIGQTSCGCFGAVRVHPWFALGLDVGALGLLALSCRQGCVAERETQFVNAIRPLVAGACGVLAILGLMAAVATIAFGSPDAGLAYLRGDRLTVVPRLVDVGDGYLGDIKEVIVNVRNWTDKPIRVVGGTSDCSCVVTDDLPLTVHPGDGQPLRVKLAMKGQLGQFTRSARLFTDDERNRSVVFRLTGRSRNGPENEAE